MSKAGIPNARIKIGVGNKHNLQMKRLLKKIATETAELTTDLLQKKSATDLASFAGVNLGGNTTQAEYQQIIDNATAHNKECKAFEKDSNKVVLEKNVALHVMKSLKRYFFFRHLNTENQVIIPLNEKFEKDADKFFNTDTYILWIVGGMGLFFGLLLGFAIDYLYFLIILVSLFCYYFIHSHKIWKKKWRKEVKFDYTKFISRNHVSTLKQGEVNSARTYKLNIELEAGSELREKETKIFFQEMAILSAKPNVKGSIAWLWNKTGSTRFTLLSVANYACSGEIRFKKDNLIIPVIETAHSFIFCFPDGYTEPMQTTKQFGEEMDVQSLFLKEKERLFITFTE